jgi:hypothetical protein
MHIRKIPENMNIQLLRGPTFIINFVALYYLMFLSPELYNGMKLYFSLQQVDQVALVQVSPAGVHLLNANVNVGTLEKLAESLQSLS